jgi:ectonucleotide pyrophosphatase/phosphodiesterase family protein 5
MKLPSRIVAWNDSVPFELRIDRVIDWITDENEPCNLVFMYFEEPDEIAHGFGPESEQVTEFIQRLDNITGYLMGKLEGLEVLDKVNLVLLSDHGFQEVKQQDMINISTIVDPKDYQVHGSTPVLHILPNPG